MWTNLYVCIKNFIEKINYGLFTIHQTSSKCNLNIQNIILNWYGKIVKSKKYEKFQNAGGGGRWGRSQLGLVVGVENPSFNIMFLVYSTRGIFVSRDPPLVVNLNA